MQVTNLFDKTDYSPRLQTRRNSFCIILILLYFIVLVTVSCFQYRHFALSPNSRCQLETREHTTCRSMSYGEGNLLDRAGALDQAAGYVQKLYWAQFADDSYSPGQMKSKGLKESIKNNNIDDEDSDKPRAPTPDTLLPATGVRHRINSIAALVGQYKSDKLERTELLKQTAALLNTPQLASIQSVRKAFNTYTQSIRFGETFQINLPPGSQERRRYIQDNTKLLTPETVITADLDLRDLHRNQILTGIDDLRAEVVYLLSSDEQDLSELERLIDLLVAECDIWFGFIPQKDVKKAYEIYIKN